MENCQSHWAGRRSRTAFKDFPIPLVLITWNSTTCSLSKISKKKPSVMEVEVGDDLFLLRMRFFFSIITWKHHARCFRQTSCKRSVWTMFYYFVINICSICWWQHCVLLADVFNLDIKATTIVIRKIYHWNSMRKVDSIINFLHQNRSVVLLLILRLQEIFLCVPCILFPFIKPSCKKSRLPAK